MGEGILIDTAGTECCCDIPLGACCIGGTCLDDLTQDVCFQLPNVTSWWQDVSCDPALCGGAPPGCNAGSTDLCVAACSSTYTVSASWTGTCVAIDLPDIAFDVSMSATVPFAPQFDHCRWMSDFGTGCDNGLIDCEGPVFGENIWTALGKNNTDCHCPGGYGDQSCDRIVGDKHTNPFTICPAIGAYNLLGSPANCTWNALSVG